MQECLINAVIILIIGVLCGIGAKWLDSVVIDNHIVLLKIYEYLDLGNLLSKFPVWLFIATILSVYSKKPLQASLNVFVFFLSFCISYHLYTIFACGFNPKEYMMIWYGATLISPILAYITWYAKGSGAISFIISTLIIAVMANFCFAMGLWYVDIISVPELCIFIATVIILFVSSARTLYNLIIGFLLAFIYGALL